MRQQAGTTSASDHYDVAVIGAGIVGLAVCLSLKRNHPSLKIAVLDKEPRVAQHQTGHNSGVIHSGIYYRPGSLKARLCVEGRRRMIEFCDTHGILHQQCGKVIVATSQDELGRLEELFRRGIENDVQGLRQITGAEIRRIEPHAAGVTGLHVPETQIVDYTQVAQAMAADLLAAGLSVRTCHAVSRIDANGDGYTLLTGAGTVEADYVVNCAGLYSDRIARQMGVAPPVQIVPFRGEYYFLRPDRRFLVRGLVYPIPDPNLPFLGVHFTPTVHGAVEAGPNAVFALAREGYSHRHIHLGELGEALTYPGLRALARRHWRTGMAEYVRSFSKFVFARSLQRLVPEIRRDDLVGRTAGVRAQAVGPAGELIDDFVIEEAPRAIHVLNAPSPAATASLAIGDHIAGIADRRFSLR